MTQWHTPGEPPGPPAAPDASWPGQPGVQPNADPRVASGTPADRPPRAARTQWVVLGVAGAFIVAAIVLLVVVLAGGDDAKPGPAPGPADTVTDTLATALHAGSAEGVRAVSCTGAKRRVLAAARPAFGASATRQGIATLQGAVGVGRISIADTASTHAGTVGLRRVGRQWCVASFVPGG